MFLYVVLEYSEKVRRSNIVKIIYFYIIMMQSRILYIVKEYTGFIFIQIIYVYAARYTHIHNVYIYAQYFLLFYEKIINNFLEISYT
jgi:hypothetical protein